MMHLYLWGLAIAISSLIRFLGRPADIASADADINLADIEDAQFAPKPIPNWQRRWHHTLVTFVVPPLLLLTTAIAVVAMGYSTSHPWDGQVSYIVALSFFSAALVVWIYLIWTALNTWYEIRRYPKRLIQTGAGAQVSQVMGRILEVPAMFSAQVGLWSSELVISQGLLTRLDDEHLAAVLAHEAGHRYYRDTFWFFWLGGLRRLTGWLPYSESLWQELLLLREIRADRWAAHRVDTLVLAESLMSVITAPLMSESICAGFSCAAPRSRLAQRIDALLCLEAPADEAMNTFKGLPWQWMMIGFALTPLLTIPFHY
jgi:Zn-dependent protease with chaperone function